MLFLNGTDVVREGRLMIPAEHELVDQPLGFLKPRATPAGALAVVEDVVLPHHQPVVQLLAVQYVDEPCLFEQGPPPRGRVVVAVLGVPAGRLASAAPCSS